MQLVTLGGCGERACRAVTRASLYGGTRCKKFGGVGTQRTIGTHEVDEWRAARE